MNLPSTETFCVGGEATFEGTLRLEQCGLDSSLAELIASSIENYIGLLTRSGQANITWSISTATAAHAFCRVTHVAPPRYNVVISAGAVMRLWAGVSGIFAAKFAAKTVERDAKVFALSRRVLVSNIASVDRNALLGLDASVVIDEFEDLASLGRCAQELVAKSERVVQSGGFGEVHRVLVWNTVREALLFVILHELSHVMAGHFSLRGGISRDSGLRDLLEGGFELDADYGAAYHLASWRQTARECGEDVLGWELTTIGLCLTMFVLEIQRLRVVDRPLYEWMKRHPEADTYGAMRELLKDDPLPPAPRGPHLYDVGRIGFVADAISDKIVGDRGEDEFERFRVGFEDGAKWFAEGMYFLVAGALTAQNGGKPLSNASLMLAGTTMRRYVDGGAEFRERAKQRCLDGYCVFNFYRNVVVTPVEDDAEQVLQDVIEPALRRLLEFEMGLFFVVNDVPADAHAEARVIDHWKAAISQLRAHDAAAGDVARDRPQ